MALLGLDIGSTSIKGVVFDEAGAVLAQAAASYRTVWNGDTAEADAEEIWQAAAEVIRRAAEQTPDIEAIGVGSHGETFIPVDGENRPVCRAIMNSDNRAREETALWEKDGGKRRLYGITGVPLHAMFAVNKIMWLKKHRPEIFEKTRLYLSAGDYILARLGVKPLTDYSLAGRTMGFDINRRSWSEEILKEAGIPLKKMPECVPSGTLAGRLGAGTAAALGLKKGAAVAVGGHDQPLSALGCGAYQAGIVTDSAGTYECLAMITNTPKNNDAAFACNVNSYCHTVDGKYITLAFFPAGFATNWFVDEFCYEDKVKAKERGLSVYACLAESIPDGPTGLIVTPHLVGSCNPYWDARARGAIYGIAPDVSRHKLFKAVYEGLALELALNAGVMEQVCGRFETVRISGGNARLPFSVQLRADLTGKQFDTMDTAETVCKGAAILAGVSCGAYRDLAEAVMNTVRTEKRYEPDAAMRERYGRQKAMYGALYPSLEKIRSM
jgi:xylulokinase